VEDAVSARDGTANTRLDTSHFLASFSNLCNSAFGAVVTNA
jgi:hypothetical protein